MIRRQDVGGGSAWPDLAGDVLVYAQARAIVAARVQPDGTLAPVWTQATPEQLMFVRAAAASGQVAAVGKGNGSGAAYLVQADRCEQLAPVTNGNAPIGILGIAAGFLVRWIEPGGLLATRWPDGTVRRETIPAPWTGTATGLLDLAADGSPIFTDAARTRRIGEWTFTKPNERSGIVVGQTDPPAVRVAMGATVFTALDAPDGLAEDPHLAVLGDGRLLVSAYTSRGASLAIIDRPYPPAEHPPKPAEPPPPSPPPPPKEPPVSSVPDYSSLVLSLPLPLAELGRLNDIADATRKAKGEDHPDTQAAEQAVNQVKGGCTETIVAALNAREGRQDWGLLSKTGGQRWIRSDGENLSTDIAFNRVMPRLVDVMTDRGPSWDVHPPADVQPVEKFRLPRGAIVRPPPVDPPPPAPPSGAAAMKGFVKIHTNAAHYTGVEPSARPGNVGDAAFPVYFDRPGQSDAAGAWEEVECTRHDEGWYDVRYVASNRQLSLQPDGRLKTRAGGEIGAWEQFQIRTEDGRGRHVLYQDDLAGPVLEFEAHA